MKKTLILVVVVGAVFLTITANAQNSANSSTEVRNDLGQYINVDLSGPGSSEATAEGGDAGALALSGSSTSSITSISKGSELHTPPLGILPPYLPYWTHGGWGTIKAFFPNGPASDQTVYERTFNPESKEDMRELWSVLNSISSYDGPLELLWWGGVKPILQIFGGSKLTHRGKGFEIANALIRDRRPKGKPLLVFIDSNVDKILLHKAGYAYVGKVSLEGKVERNWDQVYDAAVAETLARDVDILLISGGMKGVTIGSNVSFPGAAGAYSQTNYSVSLFGATSSGIVEGKGKAQVSAEGYRYWPEAIARRGIPKEISDKICVKPEPKQEVPQPGTTSPAAPQQQNGPEKTKKIIELETKRQ